MDTQSIFEEFAEYKSDLEKAKKQFPNACEKCFGEGMCIEDDDEDDDDFNIDWCSRCVQKGKCPRCAKKGAVIDKDRIRGSCSKCKWKLGNPPVLPYPPLVENETE